MIHVIRSEGKVVGIAAFVPNISNEDFVSYWQERLDEWLEQDRPDIDFGNFMLVYLDTEDAEREFLAQHYTNKILKDLK